MYDTQKTQPTKVQHRGDFKLRGLLDINKTYRLR